VFAVDLSKVSEACAEVGEDQREESFMREKLMLLEEAATVVNDGALVGLTTAVVDNAPMAFLRELIRRGIKGLRLVTLTGGGLNADLLIGAGVMAEYETCSCTLGTYGPAPNFQRAVRSGLIKLKDTT
jgi:glutaconate CoA-transferase subunit A